MVCRTSKGAESGVNFITAEYIIAKRAIDYEIACGRLVKTTTYDDEWQGVLISKDMAIEIANKLAGGI